MEELLAEAWTSPTVAVEELFGLPQPAAGALAGPHQPRDFANKLFAYEALRPSGSAGWPSAQPEPFSLQWFLDVQTQRHAKYARWIPKLMEFAKHGGERLLGLGHGLGTDWAQYAVHGAYVIVCSPSRAQLDFVRRNFALRGLAGGFVLTPPTRLPLPSASVDVACLSSLHHGIDHPRGVVDEVYRVLKPGGKVLAVTPARFDVDFWRRTCLFWHFWRRRAACRPKPEERYTAAGLRRLFQRFTEHRIYKRQLRRSEVPHLWRWLPLPLLARIMGRVLVLKAFKPLK
ncbi:MAG: class I SAM-dependent methyltransferase [Gemmataceae bacterium]|nr:class I SAM-dependent methyltransferase [Gemmataceae bacterium]